MSTAHTIARKEKDRGIGSIAHSDLLNCTLTRTFRKFGITSKVFGLADWLSLLTRYGQARLWGRRRRHEVTAARRNRLGHLFTILQRSGSGILWTGGQLCWIEMSLSPLPFP